MFAYLCRCMSGCVKEGDTIDACTGVCVFGEFLTIPNVPTLESVRIFLCLLSFGFLSFLTSQER